MAVTLKDDALVTETRPGHPVAAGPAHALGRQVRARAAAVFLLLVVLCAILGPALFGNVASEEPARPQPPPFQLEQRLAIVLGADSLGRPILPASWWRRRTR